jgi:hypothetical protein
VGTKGLYALRNAVMKRVYISMIFFMLLSCGRTGRETELPVTQTGTEINTPDTGTNGVSLIQIWPIEKEQHKGLLYRQLFWERVKTKHGYLHFVNGVVYDYDPELNIFMGIYRAERQGDAVSLFPNSFIIDDTIVTYYNSDVITPNTDVVIYKGGDSYLSVCTRDGFGLEYYSVIKSPDLIHWELTGISNPGPIVLFEDGEEVHAIVGRTVLDITNPDAAIVVRELEKPIFLPDRDSLTTPLDWDQGFGPVYEMDNRLWVRLFRAYEREAWDCFVVIDTGDFSFEFYDITLLYDKETYFREKAAKTEAGWRLYTFANDKTVVSAPFPPEGPGIIEELPPVKGL